MSFSNKILYFAVILVWIAVVFKGTYLNKLRLYVKEGTELLGEGKIFFMLKTFSLKNN